MTPRKTAAGAAMDVIAQDRAKLLKDLEHHAALLTTRRAAARRQKEKLDLALARAVSTRPGNRDWWAHGGPLDPAQGCKAAGISLSQLQDVMDRLRKSGRRL
jgi:hypothetical protein